jgi:hypothetical protein
MPLAGDQFSWAHFTEIQSCRSAIRPGAAHFACAHRCRVSFVEDHVAASGWRRGFETLRS